MSNRTGFFRIDRSWRGFETYTDLLSPAFGEARLRMPLPAHRSLTLQGPAGKLEALLWDTPEEDGSSAPALAAVVCHPHPLYGGTMHNKVVYQAAKSIHRFGVPVLRFNFRGAGLSEGIHDNGAGELEDVSAALDFLATQYPGKPLLLAGFSFGAWVGLRAGCADTRVRELIGLGLPVGDFARGSFSYFDQCDKPKLLVSGEFDRFGSPEKLREVLENCPPRVRESTNVVIVRGGDHFFAGHLAELDQAISHWLIERHSDFSSRL